MEENAIGTLFLTADSPAGPGYYSMKVSHHIGIAQGPEGDILPALSKAAPHIADSFSTMAPIVNYVIAVIFQWLPFIVLLCVKF